jgi:hypothetical protein
MWKDEILEEIHHSREEHAKSFNYDLQAICDDLRQRQVASDRQIISTCKFYVDDSGTFGSRNCYANTNTKKTL